MDQFGRFIRFVKPVVVISILLQFFFTSCDNTESDGKTSASVYAPAEQQAIPVEVLRISSGNLIPEIEASGVIRGVDEVAVISETTARVRSVNVTLGQKVKKGDILFLLDDEIASLNKDLAQEQYQNEQSNFEAIESSYNKGGVSRSDYNNARLRLLQTKNAFETAKKNFEHTKIRAPISGSLAAISESMSVGNLLNAGIQVARIVDTSVLIMEISLGERQVRFIEPGMKAYIEAFHSYTDNLFTGNVSAVGTGADPVTASFPAIITLDISDEKEILSGTAARVTIPTNITVPQLIIPTSAIVSRNGKTSVFIVENNKSSLRLITTGETLGGRTIVLDGVNEDEQLIISALSSLYDEYPVTAVEMGSTGDWL